MMVIKDDERIIDENGNVLLRPRSIITMLYNGVPLKGRNYIVSTDELEIQQYNEACQQFGDFPLDNSEYQMIDHQARRDTWFIPDKYKELDLIAYFFDEKNPPEVQNRIKKELNSFKEHGMNNFLRYCIYLGDVIREKNLTIGVGRGSSVCSYLLYLCGIHLVDPIEYGLEIEDFLK